MDTLFEKEPKKGINKTYLVGGLIGLVVVAAVIAAAMLLQGKSMDEQKQDVLADALREGSPQFEEVTKDIIIATGDNTVESPNAFGYISMFITGKIRNKGTRNINGLCPVIRQLGGFLNEQLFERLFYNIDRYQSAAQFSCGGKHFIDIVFVDHLHSDAGRVFLDCHSCDSR